MDTDLCLVSLGRERNHRFRSLRCRDVVPTLFSLLGILLLLRGQWLLGHGSLALAILGKLYPVLLLPFFAWRTRRRHVLQLITAKV